MIDFIYHVYLYYLLVGWLHIPVPKLMRRYCKTNIYDALAIPCKVVLKLNKYIIFNMLIRI